MRVAIVTFEYADGPTAGGIGTYARNLVATLRDRGHSVHVFTSASYDSPGSYGEASAVTRIAADRGTFRRLILGPFSAVHAVEPFDVVESAEFGADAHDIMLAFPRLARVVKLHTPQFLVNEINALYKPRLSRIGDRCRGIGAALRRGHRPIWTQRYSFEADIEHQHTALADVVTAPSGAIARRIELAWELPQKSVHVIPNPFIPGKDLLEIPPETKNERVCFIGRLEARKGIIEFAQSIPRILRYYPNCRFRFVGRTQLHPSGRIEMQDFIMRELQAYSDSLEFLNGVANARLGNVLAESDICVFPSVWENFPYACLEAMAAARGVIASSAGGMSEMIESDINGVLVPPRDAHAIAEAVVALLRDPEGRAQKGELARMHVCSSYSPAAIGPEQERVYRLAVEIAARRCDDNASVSKQLART